jgi:hypothetical protein
MILRNVEKIMSNCLKNGCVVKWNNINFICLKPYLGYNFVLANRYMYYTSEQFDEYLNFIDDKNLHTIENNAIDEIIFPYDCQNINLLFTDEIINGLSK